MNTLQYKNKSKSKAGLVFATIILLLLYYSEGGSFLHAFSDIKGIWLLVLIRSILPAVLVLVAGVLVLIGKNTIKPVMILLMGFFTINLIGQTVLFTKGTVHLGFVFTFGNVANVLINVFAIVFTVMVCVGSLKASYGAFATTFVKSIMIVFHAADIPSFLLTVFSALFAMFVFMSIEDFEDKPLKKIRGEEIGFPRRNVGSCVILTLMTLGIFGIVWLVKICKDLRRLHGDENPVGGEVLLFLLVPFYSVYWAYDKGKQMYEDSKRRGGNLTDRKYVYMFMNLLFMQLFTLGFIQTQLNSYQRR